MYFDRLTGTMVMAK